MSTNATIAYQAKDKVIEVIYCHWDGYPEGVGKRLKEHYTTEEKLEKLFALGDLSSLGTEPIDYPEGWKPTEVVPEDRCLSYRARGDSEAETAPFTFFFLTHYFEELSPQQFNYLWLDGKWQVWENSKADLREL